MSSLERILAVWLGEKLNVIGAEGFVREHGARNILTALKRIGHITRSSKSWADYTDQEWQAKLEEAPTRGQWEPNANVTNPGGLLRYSLRA